jgi:hypothetical protein
MGLRINDLDTEVWSGSLTVQDKKRFSVVSMLSFADCAEGFGEKSI